MWGILMHFLSVFLSVRTLLITIFLHNYYLHHITDKYLGHSVVCDCWNILFMNISPIVLQTDGRPSKNIRSDKVLLNVIAYIGKVMTFEVMLHKIHIVRQCGLLTSELLRN